MPVSYPSFDENVTAVSADMQASISATSGGQPVPADLSPGSVLGAFVRAVCLVADALFRLLGRVDASLRWKTAQGADLDDQVAILGIVRVPALFGSTPVKFSAPSVVGSDLVIPVGQRVLATDASGQPTIVLFGAQDLTQPTGTAGIVPAGSSAGWAFCTAAVAGAAGNLAAGQVTTLGAPLTGIITVGNPPVAVPTAPTLAVVGTPGGATATYQLVAKGQTGSTTPSATATITTAPGTLNGTDKVRLTWTAVDDATGYDVLKGVGSLWRLLGSTTGAVLTLDDTGQALTSYVYPTTNTTNQGIGGADAEGDESLRARAPKALTVAGKSTMDALLGAIGAVPGVVRVFGLDITPSPGYVTFYLEGVTNPLSAEDQALVQAAIDDNEGAGISCLWNMLSPVPVAIAYTAQVVPGLSLADQGVAVGAINSAIAFYFSSLALGAGVNFTALVGKIYAVQGVLNVLSLTMTPAGGSTYGTGAGTLDVPGVSLTLYTVGTVAATITT